LQIVEQIKKAGVVGAGGAGFPTHIKVSGKADIVIANGAECEPLLRVDRMMMENFSKEIVAGLELVIKQTHAKKGVIALKDHYKDAMISLTQAIKGKNDISLHLMKSYYPAGDEQQMVCDVTGKVVPTGGIPLDVGAVVCNVSTLINIDKAVKGVPVTDKYLTVTGEVDHPMTICVPIGTTFSQCIKKAGGPADMMDYAMIIGGPAMGYIEDNMDAVVTKTTGGIIVLPKDHAHIKKKTSPLKVDVKLAKSVCCQCNYCTQLCPRNVLGLKVEPHVAMRAIGYGVEIKGDINGIFSCCNCGLCSFYACDFGLMPSRMMTRIKDGLVKNGIRPEKKVDKDIQINRELIKVPTKRFIARLGLSKYDVDANIVKGLLKVREVTIPLKMHIGAPCEAIVKTDDAVKVGDVIGKAPEGKLGTNIHASIDGVIKSVDENTIRIGVK
jgi:Na+-translocating ferredoxin:NAD+ oxidoreductase RnfC subunit